ncbi:unnamed protein product [Spirodela intermedia]|uniref:Uncharacterized protein n=2 Tax=Spirodela intermedia TaxID=51605 RepID=A0A7I8KNW8_SPIIN|nr:unnamed protein product [Spirodela intermedia]CAA6670432.1 unnamed protein product [Spirodela intermedia]CAA6674740.1 unnamed protein product [Spirodela intermedia]CAA7399509.1 unnamed protein product [Spirodela intermedia]
MGASICVFVEGDREMKVINILMYWMIISIMKWITTVMTSKLPNLGCDGRMKPIEIDPSMKLLVIVLKGQEVDSKGLIDIHLLDESLEVTVVSLKKRITFICKRKETQRLISLYYHELIINK